MSVGALREKDEAEGRAGEGLARKRAGGFPSVM